MECRNYFYFDFQNKKNIFALSIAILFSYRLMWLIAENNGNKFVYCRRKKRNLLIWFIFCFLFQVSGFNQNFFPVQQIHINKAEN